MPLVYEGVFQLSPKPALAQGSKNGWCSFLICLTRFDGITDEAAGCQVLGSIRTTLAHWNEVVQCSVLRGNLIAAIAACPLITLEEFVAQIRISIMVEWLNWNV